MTTPKSAHNDPHGGGPLVAAVVVRAHGLRGEVVLDVRTDRAAERFSVGAQFETDPADAGPLTLVSARPIAKGWLAQFEEVPDRTAADALRSVQLLVPPDVEPDAWYPHELTGLDVLLPDGAEVGHVARVEFGAAQDLLVIERPGKELAYVPLLTRFVPHVDLAAGVVHIDPPDGLL